MDPENGLNFQIIKITRKFEELFESDSGKLQNRQSYNIIDRGIIINACLRDEERFAFVSKCSVSKFAEWEGY